LCRKTNQLEVETKIIQPEQRQNCEGYLRTSTVKSTDFTPLVAPNQPPATANEQPLAAGDRGIQVTDVTTAETPKGPVKRRR
jgi:hypothetical protein